MRQSKTQNRKSKMFSSLVAFLLLAGPTQAQQPLPPEASRPLLTIGAALRAALKQNPDLLNIADFLLSAQVNERGVASTFLPQVTPFFSTDRSRESQLRSETYGLFASEQFRFGTLVEGQASLTRLPGALPETPYGSDYRLTLTQPLLRGADPAVTAEPLRQAKRSTSAQSRSLEIFRRRTVLLVYQAYLGLARQQEATRLAVDRMERARKISEFSGARFAAGSVSRIDVLRAEQQEAAAVVARNEAENLLEDFRDSLRRAAGLARDLEFSIEPPRDLPSPEPDIEQALEAFLDRRPEALEARDQITDAEFALRIAKSQQLPSLQAVVTYEASSLGATAADALRPRSPALLFGFRSQYGLNAAVLFARRRTAEIQLETRKRNFQLLADDLTRELRRAYRRLDALKKNYDIAAQNEQVAELQAKVAQLRFEKGLSDNFYVIDAENLLNAARLLEIDSRFNILLARLDCLFAAGRLEIQPFLQQP